MKRFGMMVVGLGLASAALAAERNGSAGTSNTGEFSDPALIAHWGYGDKGNGLNSFAVDQAVQRAGKPTIRQDAVNGGDDWAYFPNTADMDLDVSGAKALKFALKTATADGANPQWSKDDVAVAFLDMSGKQAFFDGTAHRMAETRKDWVEFTVPVAGHVDAEAAGQNWKPEIDASFDWKHIACAEIHVAFTGKTMRWFSGVQFVGDKPIEWWLSSFDKPDLTVTYAEQTPRYKRNLPTEPDPKHNCPVLVGAAATEKVWPAAGEKVTYLVHVKNAGFTASKPTDFECKIDGAVVKKAEIPALAPREEKIVEVEWSWKQGPFDFVATVDPAGKLDEIGKKNNTLAFKTDAYKLDAVCEKAIVEPLDKVVSFYNSFCFENWMTGATVDQMNWMFKHSKYDFAPNGAEISVRLDKIFLVDEIPNDPSPVDKPLGLDVYDGTWHYPMRAIGEWTGLAKSYDWALCHELTHQMGIVDDYCMDLGVDNNKVNGKPYLHPEGGIMGGGRVLNNTQPAYADMDVAGMNLTKGHRRGFYGEYLYNIPLENTLVLTLDGKPLAGTDVKVYQKDIEANAILDAPIQEGKSDDQGKFPLANRPVPKEYTTATGCTLHPNPWGYIDVVARNGLFMVRAQKDGKYYFGFIDIGYFVCEYARGHKDKATYTIEMKAE